MAVIATKIEPHRVTRIFFDCRPADPDPREIVRVARAMTEAAEASPHPEGLPRAA
jgi:hypothetical protein